MTHHDPTLLDRPGLLDGAVSLAIAAGRAALVHYRPGVAFDTKADGSPITLADRDAHRVLVAELPRLAPGVPVLSEESSAADLADRSSWRRLWVVDPLDGTKEFLKASGEFTVNVALVEDGEPVLGVVHVPVPGVTYFASRRAGAFVRRGDETARAIRTRPLDPARVVVAASRDHRGPELDALLARIPGAVVEPAGSALKFGLVAEGRADLYVRTGRTMEWDTAAGHCIVAVAGGRVAALDGNPLRYGKESLANPEFVAWGDPSVDWPTRLRAARAAGRSA